MPEPAELEALAEESWKLSESCMRATFPAHEQINAHAALNLEAKLSWAQRKELVYALAVHEGLPKDDLWYLGGNSIAFHASH